MFKIAFEILIKVAMSEHMYSFNGDLRKQKAGGTIGNVLTCAVAVLFTVWWCQKFLDKVNEACRDLSDFVVYLLKIYIDDQNLACEALPPGARLMDGKVTIVESEVEGDVQVPDDQRTAKILLEIANSVSNFIKLTSDCPSLHNSGFMPILDLQVKAENNKLIWKFYKKEVANPLLIMKDSAMPFKVKRASLSCEALRRLRNTSRELPWDENHAEILSEFSHKLMCSGWDAKHRYNFIQAGLLGYKKQLEQSDAGVTPLYRPWEWNREERNNKKLLTKSSWYRPDDATMFVPATPGSELRNTIQKIVTNKTSELGMNVRVIETSGRKVRDSLVRLDLTGCFYPKCLACKSGLEGASHTRSGVQYYITCQICNTKNILAEYHGESGFNAVHRLAEHEADIKNKNTKNGMAKHLEIFHKENVGDPESFQYSSVATFQKRLERQISEGVAITKSDINHTREHILINEHHNPAVHRTSVSRQVRNGS